MDDLLAQKIISTFLMAMDMDGDVYFHYEWRGFLTEDLIVMCQREELSCTIQNVTENIIQFVGTHGWQDCRIIDLMLGRWHYRLSLELPLSMTGRIAKSYIDI